MVPDNAHKSSVCRGVSVHAAATCFTLGGITFDVLPAPGVAWQLPDSCRGQVLVGAHALPVLANVVCRVSLDPALVGRREPFGARWQRLNDGVRVHADLFELDIHASGVRAYSVAARIASEAAIAQMLLHVAATIAELAGGLCLHATAVEVAGDAVLLLGPSGAGKSTAASMLAHECSPGAESNAVEHAAHTAARLGPARCLANDRVNVFARAGSECDLWAWALPVGRPSRLAPSVHVALPLAGLLRIHQAVTPAVRAVSTGQAVLLVREAVEVAADSGFFEGERLAAVSAVSLAAKSGIAEVALTRSWLPELAHFLGVVRAEPQAVCADPSRAAVSSRFASQLGCPEASTPRAVPSFANETNLERGISV